MDSNVPLVRGEMYLPSGERVVLRPIRADDAPRLQAFDAQLSRQTVYRRFFSFRGQLSAADAEHFARVDYHIRMAVVAEHRTPEGDELLGVARYEPTNTPHTAEFAIVIADRFQHAGIGHALLRALVVVARSNGITRFVGEILAENLPMLQFVRSVDLPPTMTWQGGTVRFSWEIAAVERPERPHRPAK